MRELIVDATIINDASTCYVIAEIGHNHQGNLEKAKAIIDAAKKCGANAVKFQKRNNFLLYTTEMVNKPYINKNSFGKTYGEHREFLEFNRDEYISLKEYCQQIGITFFATAFDIPSAKFLNELDLPAYKIASGDLKNVPLLKMVAQFGKPIIISTGGSNMSDIECAYKTVSSFNQQICFLHCTASYPAVEEEMNLRVISSLRERFPDVTIGLSDHYDGIAMADIAFTLGARVIEKHFTLNRSWKGTDHAFSLESADMHQMILNLRRTHIALGDGIKRIFSSEIPAITKMGKTLVAATDLNIGHILNEEDIAIKSPGGGLSPYYIGHIVGRKLRQPLKADSPFMLDFFEISGSQDGEDYV